MNLWTHAEVLCIFSNSPWSRVPVLGVFEHAIEHSRDQPPSYAHTRP